MKTIGRASQNKQPHQRLSKMRYKQIRMPNEQDRDASHHQH